MNNGEILKQKLRIEIDSSILDKSLYHTSYLNNRGENCEKVKVESSIGKYLIEICYYINQLINTTKSINEISQEYDMEYICREIDKYFSIDELVYLSDGERKTRAKDKVYIDVISRIMYTIYSIKGLKTVLKIISKILINYTGNIDYKTKLQEYVQSKKQVVSYVLMNQSGPAHDRNFEVKVIALGKEVQASGKSKKIAEKQAAKKYLEIYKIQNQTKSKSAKGRKNLFSEKNIDLAREKELDKISKILELDMNNISISVLNAAFIHKSFVNGRDDLTDNSCLIPLGSSILSFYLSIYMYKNNNKYNDSSKEFVKDLGILVRKDTINNLICDDFNKMDKFIKVTPGFTDLQLIISDVFKSILCSIVINGCVNKDVTFSTSEREIFKLIDKYYQNKIFDDHICYYSWLNSFTCKLGIEYNIEDLNKHGKDNETIFIAKLVVNLNKYGINNFIIEKQSSSKKDLFADLSESFYRYLVKTCNITKFIEINNNYKLILLRDLVNTVLKIDGYYYPNINILGGLCLREWNKSECIKIVIAFRNSKLNSELTYLYNRWQILYKDKSEEIKEIFDVEGVSYLIEEVKYDLMKEFDPFAEYLLENIAISTH